MKAKRRRQTHARGIAADFNHLAPTGFEGSQGQEPENLFDFILPFPQLPVGIDLARREGRFFRVGHPSRNLGNWGSMGNGFRSLGFQRYYRIIWGRTLPHFFPLHSTVCSPLLFIRGNDFIGHGFQGNPYCGCAQGRQLPFVVLGAQPFAQSGLVGPALHAQKLPERLVLAQASRIGQANASAAKAEKDLRDDGLGGKTARLVLARVHADAKLVSSPRARSPWRGHRQSTVRRAPSRCARLGG